MSPLSQTQKARLCQLSDQAFKLHCTKEHEAGRVVDTSVAARSAFRHGQVRAACGLSGLRYCTQREYKLIEAHLLDLVGEAGLAMNALVRHQDNDRRQLEWKITQILEEMGRPLEYAAGICSKMFGRNLMDATPEQLLKVFIALRVQKSRNEKQQLATA